MGNKRPSFEPNTVYHVYNHGNAEGNIFREEENYHYFLKRYAHYIYPIAGTYGFCLLPNHFHFALKIRAKEVLINFFDKSPQGFGNPEGLSNNLSNSISHQFGTLLNSYTKSFNNYYDRKGSLFRHTTNRKPITNKVYYKRLITCIHQNPVKHGFVKKPAEWLFSSYHILLSKKETQMERSQVLDWFGSREGFVEFHRKNREIDAEPFC